MPPRREPPMPQTRQIAYLKKLKKAALELIKLIHLGGPDFFVPNYLAQLESEVIPPVANLYRSLDDLHRQMTRPAPNDVPTNLPNSNSNSPPAHRRHAPRRRFR